MAIERSNLAQVNIQDAICDDVDGTNERHYVYIEFSNSTDFSNANLVIPTAGTVTITASENNVNYGSIDGGDDIDVTTQDYTRPVLLGGITAVKAVSAGIVGAAYFRIRVASYN